MRFIRTFFIIFCRNQWWLLKLIIPYYFTSNKKETTEDVLAALLGTHDLKKPFKWLSFLRLCATSLSFSTFTLSCTNNSDKWTTNVKVILLASQNVLHLIEFVNSPVIVSFLCTRTFLSTKWIGLIEKWHLLKGKEVEDRIWKWPLMAENKNENPLSWIISLQLDMDYLLRSSNL